MAVVKQTYTRPFVDTDWYMPPESERNYINNTYPNLIFGYETEGDFISIKTRTGSLEDCQLFYNDLNDLTNTVFTARRNYLAEKNITWSIELIE